MTYESKSVHQRLLMRSLSVRLLYRYTLNSNLVPLNIEQLNENNWWFVNDLQLMFIAADTAIIMAGYVLVRVNLAFLATVRFHFFTILKDIAFNWGYGSTRWSSLQRRRTISALIYQWLSRSPMYFFVHEQYFQAIDYMKTDASKNKNMYHWKANVNAIPWYKLFWKCQP